MKDCLYKREYNRLLRYGRSLGCKISVRLNSKDKHWSGDFYILNNVTHITVCFGKKFTWIDKMLILGHELGHHFDFAIYKRIDSVKEDNAYEYYIACIKKKKSIPVWCMDLVSDIETRADYYRRQIFHDLKLRIPVLATILDEREHIYEIEEVFTSGKLLTIDKLHKERAKLKKRVKNKYKGFNFSNWTDK